MFCFLFLSKNEKLEKLLNKSQLADEVGYLYLFVYSKNTFLKDQNQLSL